MHGVFLFFFALSYSGGKLGQSYWGGGANFALKFLGQEGAKFGPKWGFLKFCEKSVDRIFADFWHEFIAA